MSVKYTTDFEPLIEAVASTQLDRIAQETVHLLRQNVPPFFIIGHAGLPAAWGDTDGHLVSALAAGGHIADWTRSIPASAEEDHADARQLVAVLPLTAALAVAAPAIQAGERAKHDLPEPLFPANITHPRLKPMVLALILLTRKRVTTNPTKAPAELQIIVTSNARNLTILL